MPEWYAVAPPGLEPVVAREVASVGLRVRVEPGGVGFDGPVEDAPALVRRLRTPGRLLRVVAEGPARTLADLAALVRAADWGPFLVRGSEPEVAAAARGSRLHFRGAIEDKARFALKDACRLLPPAPVSPQRVQVRLADDVATVSIDAGGDLLHRRGWRQAAGKAPLRENLAACLLVAAGYTGDEPLLDPFCGSGTIAIEAALLAAGRSPHGERAFACDGWPSARAPALPRPPSAHAPISGSDHHPRSLDGARENAARAGVRVEWQFADVASVVSPATTGLLATNPPYGERLGRKVDGVWAAFGETVRARFPRWRLAFLAPDPRLAAMVRRDVERLTVFANGGIRVGLYGWEPPTSAAGG